MIKSKFHDAVSVAFGCSFGATALLSASLGCDSILSVICGLVIGTLLGYDHYRRVT